MTARGADVYGGRARVAAAMVVLEATRHAALANGTCPEDLPWEALTDTGRSFYLEMVDRALLSCDTTLVGITARAAYAAMVGIFGDT